MPDVPSTPTRARRGAGRPRVAEAERLERMYIALTPAVWDRLARKALALNIPIARLVRQELGRIVP